MRYILPIILLLFLSACLRPNTAPPGFSSGEITDEVKNQNEFLMSETRSQEKRMLDIWWNLSVSNLDLCPKNHIQNVYGFHLSDRRRYSRNKIFKKSADGKSKLVIRGNNIIKAYDKVYGSSKDWITVGHVYKDSPAEVAGLKTKDRIISVDYKGYRNRKAEVKEFYEYLADVGEDDKSIVLEISRGNVNSPEFLKVNISPEASCYYPIYVVHDDGLNAATDGESIYFHMEMLDFLRTDEELATVIGHEMAHASEQHIRQARGRAILGSILDIAAAFGGIYTAGAFSEAAANAYSQTQETEADYVGLYMVARAGYDISGTPRLWRRMAAKNPQSNNRNFFASHPTPAQRYIVLNKTIEEIERKKKFKLPLYPELR